MTLDEAKEEVLALIGPEGQLVMALRKRGLAITEWKDTGKIVLTFNIKSVLFDFPSVEMDLKLCGQNVRLELEEWTHKWNSIEQWHDCVAVYIPI